MKIYTLSIEPYEIAPGEHPVHFLHTDEDDRDQRIKDILNEWAEFENPDLGEAPDNLTGQALLDWFKATVPKGIAARLSIEQWDTAEDKWAMLF